MLGLSEKKIRSQEQPFAKVDMGTRFVSLVIIMMSALATLALGGAHTIVSLRGAWVSDLSGQISIEIPALNAEGFLRPASEMELLADNLVKALEQEPGILLVEILPRTEIETLIAPWLGAASTREDLPLPTMIGVSLAPEAGADTLEYIKIQSRYIDAGAQVDTHQSWVQDLRRFTGVLLGASGFMALAVILCAMLCVSGAVQAQLSAHQADIALLHLMGASDNYIGRQFVRVVAKDVGYASLFGTGGGILLLQGARFLTGTMQDMGFEATQKGALYWLLFLLLPALITVLCFVTARITVMRTLEKMP